MFTLVRWYKNFGIDKYLARIRDALVLKKLLFAAFNYNNFMYTDE